MVVDGTDLKTKFVFFYCDSYRCFNRSMAVLMVDTVDIVPCNLSFYFLIAVFFTLIYKPSRLLFFSFLITIKSY